MRKILCLSALVALVATLIGAAPASAGEGTVWRSRADSAYAALQRYLSVQGGDGLYREKYPAQDGDNPYSFLWSLREAAAANLDVAGMPGRHVNLDAFDALEQYRDPERTPPGYDSYPPPPLGTRGDLFYDDNDIVGLELVRAFLATHDATFLTRAERVFPVVISGWDTDATHPCPGGMHWTQADWNTIKATNATALGAELAAHLYELTHRNRYLRWAKRLYDWNRACTRSGAGLYYNSIDFQGTIDKTLWIYNSGAMIGAGALLYRATHDQSYLAQARSEAAGAMRYWNAEDRTYQQPAVFNAIYFKNLLLLDSLAPNPAYRRALVDYATRLWQQNRDPQTGLFRFQASGGGAYDPAARAETLEQSAVVQLFAVLAWKSHDYGRIA